MARCALLMLLVALAAPIGAQDASKWHVDIETPEMLGYTIGDLFQHRARLVLADPYRLDENSLPRPRRLNSWLELRRVELDVDRGLRSRAYDLVLTYQILNTRGTVRGIATPPVVLTVFEEDGTFPVVIPPWGFSVLPVTAPEEIPPGSLPALRPSRPPPPMDVDAIELRIALLSAALLSALAYLLYVNGLVPFLRRGNEPFARACRRLKRLRHRPFDAPARREAYRHLHAAFNETAGRVVFAGDVDGFIAEKPGFRELRSSIESFYADSRRLFFAGDTGDGAAADGLDPLVHLAERFRDAERSG